MSKLIPIYLFNKTEINAEIIQTSMWLKFLFEFVWFFGFILSHKYSRLGTYSIFQKKGLLLYIYFN